MGDNSIPFKLVNNLIIIVADCDHSTGNFVFDTGSDAIFLNTPKKTETEAKTFNTLNGNVLTKLTKISCFKIGEITKKNIEAYKTNLSNIEDFLSIELAGIIGAELFNPHSIFIDFLQNKILFFKNPPNLYDYNLTNNIKFSMKLGVPTTEVIMLGEKYFFIIDSGATIHLISQDILTAIPDNFQKLDTGISIETLENTSAKTKVKYKINSFKIGENTFTDQNCLSNDFSFLNENQNKTISGVLSLTKLSKQGILIDFHRMKIYY